MDLDTAILLVIVFAGFIAIPYVPHESFMVMDSAMVRIILLLIMVYSLRYGPVVGVAVFMLVAGLLLERNYRIISYSSTFLRSKRRGAAPRDGPERDMPESAAVYYVDDEVPREGDVEYRPADDTGDNEFEPVAPSQDQKVVMKSAPLGARSGTLFF